MPEIYERLIPSAWIDRANRAFIDNPMMSRREKVGEIYAPLSIGQMEQLNFAEKLEEEFRDFKEDTLQGLDELSEEVVIDYIPIKGIASFFRKNLSFQ